MANKWEVRATKRLGKTQDVEYLRRIVSGYPTIIANMDRARRDPTNPDRKWAAGQHMVLIASYTAAVARLAQLEGK